MSCDAAVRLVDVDEATLETLVHRAAQGLGAKTVVGETTASNAKALAVLESLGFELLPPTADGTVRAREVARR